MMVNILARRVFRNVGQANQAYQEWAVVEEAPERGWARDRESGELVYVMSPGLFALARVGYNGRGKGNGSGS